MSEPPLRTLSLHPGDPTWGSDPPVFKGWLPCLPAVCSEAGPLTFELGLLSPSDRLSICLLATPFNARPHSCFLRGPRTGLPVSVSHCCFPSGPGP